MDIKMTEDNLKKILEKLYQLNNGKLFEEIFLENWHSFGFHQKPSLIQFEDFLKEIIFDYTKIEKNSTDYEKKRKNKKRDELLLMFGLLEGYYHTRIDSSGTKFPVPDEERRSRYVKEGNYIELRDKDSCQTEDQKMDALYRKFRRELEPNQGYFLLYFFRIIEKGATQKIINERMGESLKTIILPTNELRIELPEPYIVREKSSDSVSSDETKESLKISTDSQRFKNEPNEQRPNILHDFPVEPVLQQIQLIVKNFFKNIFGHLVKIRNHAFAIIAVILLILSIILICMICIHDTLSKQSISRDIETLPQHAEEELMKTPPDEINILNKEIYLPLGEDYRIPVETVPR